MNLAPRTSLFAVVALLVLTTGISVAAVSEEQVQALIERIEAQDRRIAELERVVKASGAQSQPVEPAMSSDVERPPANATVARVDTAPVAPAWAERIRLQGDMRFRQENIEVEDAGSRSRQRIRARAALVAQVDRNVEVGLGLATGNDNPVGANETLGRGFSKMGMDLDLAYFDWAALPGTHVLGGKYKNPFYRPGGNGLIWDGDLRPEGISVHWDNGVFFASGSGFTAQEDATGSNTFIFGVQMGGRMHFNEHLSLMVGASYFDLNDVQGRPLFFSPDDSYGNTVVTNPDGELVYAYGYEEVEAFVELTTTIARLPLSVFFDYVNNRAVDDLNTGWATGFTVGSATVKGAWEFGYVYEDLEADAVVGLFTDSDFGRGGTDARGHRLRGRYALTDRTNLQAAYLITEAGGNKGDWRDYNRLQLDVNFRY